MKARKIIPSGRGIAAAISAAFSPPIRNADPPAPRATAAQRQEAAPSPTPTGLAGSPRDRTVARFGVRTPDLSGGPAPILRYPPTGPRGKWG